MKIYFKKNAKNLKVYFKDVICCRKSIFNDTISCVEIACCVLNRGRNKINRRLYRLNSSLSSIDLGASFLYGLIRWPDRQQDHALTRQAKGPAKEYPGLLPNFLRSEAGCRAPNQKDFAKISGNEKLL